LPPIASILPPLPRLKIVDVGALWTGGDGDRYTNLERALPCEVIGFEPIGAEHRKLVELGRPWHRYFPYFIGDGSAQTFYECRAPFTSSLLEPNLALAQHFERLPEYLEVVTTSQVQTTRLDDIPETAGVDFLKVDVQGGEMMVFEGAVQRLKSALVVDVEVEFIPLYMNQPLFSDIDIFLRAFDFTLHQIQPIGLMLKPPLANSGSVPTSLHASWGEAVYVRGFPTFENLEPLALLKLAAILHENYKSYDLAGRALAVFDRMTRSLFYPRYAKLMAL
jgi:FkbM family methyltransferase